MSELKTILTDTAALIKTLATANSTGAISTGAALNFLHEKPPLFMVGKIILLVYLFGLLMFVVAFAFNGMATVDADYVEISEKERRDWTPIFWLTPKTPEAYMVQTKRNGQISLLFAGASSICFLAGLIATIWAVARFL